MKVLHINCNYLGTSLHQLMIEELDRLGVGNQVYVPTYDKAHSVIQPHSNVIVSECFRKHDRLVFDYKQKKIFQDIERKIDVSKFDLIHAYTLFTDGNCARRLSEKYGIPFVVAVRNTDVNDFFRIMFLLRKRGIRTMCAAKAIFFLSKTYKEQVLRRYVPSSIQNELIQKMHIIPNGIDVFWRKKTLQRSERTLKTSEPIRLMYAGVINRNKNIGLIQRAIKILKHRGIETRLTVVGKIADKNEFQKISSDENTTCLPACGKENLINLYRYHDIFVMPSHHETFGLVYAEAMSQGLPVIYTRGQGFDGQFQDGAVGYAVSDIDAEELADKIELCIKNYADICKVATDCAQKFSWEKICLQYRDIYRSLMGLNSNRGS